MVLRNVIHKTDNLIVQQLQQGKHPDFLVIVGTGHSVSVDDNNVVTFVDPLFTPPRECTMYGDLATVFTVYFPKNCAGLESAGKDLADFINQLDKGYKCIILHGLYKCGVCFIDLTKWLTKMVHVVSVAAPFFGTTFADVNTFGRSLNRLERFFYLKFFSDSPTDRDICPNSCFLQQLDMKPAFQNHDCRIIVAGYELKNRGNIGSGLVPFFNQVPANYPFTVIDSLHSHALERSAYVVNAIQRDYTHSSL